MSKSVNNVFSNDVAIINPPKTRNRFWLALIFFVVNAAAVFYYGYLAFEGQEQAIFIQSQAVFSQWSNNYQFVIIAISLFFVALLAETLKRMAMLKAQTGHWHFRLSIKVAFLGKYYDNVTPLASGGQPFQIYYLIDGGIAPGVASAIPLLSFFLSQVAHFGLNIFMFIYIAFNPGIIDGNLITGLLIAACFGAVFSILMPLTIIFVTVFPQTSNKFISFLTHLILKLKFIKNKQKNIDTLHYLQKEYITSMNSFKTGGLWLWMALPLSFVYKISLASIPYFVLLASGISANYLSTTVLTVLAATAVSFIPTPGNSGAAEFGFNTVFSSLATIGSAFMFWGMLLWRFASYYLSLLIGLGMLAYQGLKKRSHKFLPK
jgi:uncharacterized protein (TIRG00374 family)